MISAGFNAMWEMWTRRAVGGSVVGNGDRCIVKGEVAEGFVKLVFMTGEVGVDIVERCEARDFSEPMLLRRVANLGRCKLLTVL